MGKMRIRNVPALGRLLCLSVLLWPAGARGQEVPSPLASVECPAAWRRPAEVAAAVIVCATIHVMEDRKAGAEAQSLKLFVARISARLPDTNSPLVVLTGGPGDAASAEVGWWLNSSLRDSHDIILVDQRGSGLSRPSLDCPEFDTSDDDDPLATCRDRLLAAGINLSSYNAESIAQDFAAVIRALEVDNVNLYGRSYGARLALLLAEILPQRIHAMALDSAYTGGESALAGAAAKTLRSMQRLFADCGANDGCRSAYPRLSTQFTRAVAALNLQPVEVAGILPDAALRLDGESFVFLLRDMLADAKKLPYAPAVIAAIAQADDGYLASAGSALYGPGSLGPVSYSEGLFFSAFCADEVGLTSAAEVQESAEELPPAYLPLMQGAQDILADCGRWGSASDTIRVESPSSEIPTLYLSGAYDPIANVDARLSRTPRAWRLVFPHLGHGVLEYESCAETVTGAFLANPAKPPFNSCLDDLRPPAFHIRQND